MLPIMLTQRVGSASVLSGVMLGVLSAAARGSTLFLGRLIEKISTLWLMQISLAIIVLGLVSFAWLLQVSLVFALLGLMLFGVGISLVNFTLRGHIIATTADSKEQASFFFAGNLVCELRSCYWSYHSVLCTVQTWSCQLSHHHLSDICRHIRYHRNLF